MVEFLPEDDFAYVGDIDDPEICSAVLEQLAAVLDVNWREMPVLFGRLECI